MILFKLEKKHLELILKLFINLGFIKHQRYYIKLMLHTPLPAESPRNPDTPAENVVELSLEDSQ